MTLVFLVLLYALAQGQEALSLSVVPSVTTVSANEPIVIQVSIANKDSDPWEAAIDGEFNEDFILSKLANGTKRVLLWNSYSDPDSGRFGGSVKLARGASHTKAILLNEWVRQLAPGGTYAFEIGLRGRSTTPASFHVTVLTRDPASIRKICYGLTEEILSSPLERGLHLAHVLSYAIDPEAVPFMQKVAEKRDDYAWAMVKGLVAIGDRHAIAALGMLMTSASSELTRSTARGNLGSLRHSTRDETIKREIDAILQWKQ